MLTDEQKRFVNWQRIPVKDEAIAYYPETFDTLNITFREAMDQFLQKAENFVKAMTDAGIPVEQIAQEYEMQFYFDDGSDGFWREQPLPVDERILQIAMRIRRKRE